MAEDGGIAGIGEAFRDLQRVGPDLMLVASEIAVASPGGVGAGAFYIDPERAQECIDRLKAVALDVADVLPSLLTAYFSPPARDEVSANMTQQAWEMLRQSEAFVRAWRDDIASTVAALEQQLAAYRRAETANRAQRA
ncbi:PE domain-containing protein [Pseudonocardia acidicola]|uniref:PE domain-containing protein n=1 Tax=Pseudonocardia acidicola TaxID=2724939 RepID=A0ABX1SDH9_9PSEU|nr:PE domain-containing protein [Pseudonocardia acidicola]NMH99625.1 PE domain-containing protein [Pseudonocardia acidicola]